MMENPQRVLNPHRINMRFGKLSVLTSLLFLLAGCYEGTPQIKFIRYQDFGSAYQKNPDLHLLSKDFDLLSVLLLDSAYRQHFVTRLVAM